MARPSTSERLQLRRELRTELARRRRRINASIGRLHREGRRLVSWRTHVARHPLAALAGAFGVGLALSAGLPRGGWLRSLTGWAIRAAFAAAPASLLQDVMTSFIGAMTATKKQESA